MSKRVVCAYDQPHVSRTVAPPPKDAAKSPEWIVSAAATNDFDSQLSVYEGVESQHFDNSFDESDSLVSSIWELDSVDTTQSTNEHHRDLPLLSNLQSSQIISILNDKVAEPTLFDMLLPKSDRSFQPRKTRNDRLSLNRNYVACTLRSYPYMLLPDKALPSFIHPQCLLDITTDNGVSYKGLPGSLAVCGGIVQIYSHKTPSNTIFLWKAVKMEQERIAAQVRLKLCLNSKLQYANSDTW